MAKANKKSHSVFPVPPPVMPMGQSFKILLEAVDDMAETSRPIMPLFAAALDLSKKILKMYQKAFEAGKKYAFKK